MRSPGFLRSPNFQAIGKLSAGTLVAQIIAFGTTPIVTRLYSPADYGNLAVFTAAVAIIMTVATGRYEAAIVLPQEDSAGDLDALALVRLSSAISLVVSIVCLLGIAMMRVTGFDPWFGDLGVWAFFIPLAVLIGSVQAILVAYATRRREYARIARIAPLSRVANSAIQIGLGLLKPGMSGLMVGALLSPLVGMWLLLKIMRDGVSELGELARREWLSAMRAVAFRYVDFPKINLWFALLNGLAWNIQILIIGAFFAQGDVGQYSLSVALLSVPGSLVVAAVSQVYLRELSARSGEMPQALRLARNVVFGLGLLSLVPFTVVAIFGPELFSVLFGEQWELAGEISRAMVPLLWARFVSTTLSVTLVVYRQQVRLLVWQVVSLLATVGAYAGGAALGLSLVSCTWIASAVVGPLYLLLIPMAFHAIRSGPPPQITREEQVLDSDEVDPHANGPL